MLRQISIENFKPFGRQQTAKLGRITLLYGPNSGGKSSLIQALMLLRQSAEGQTPGGAALITQGEFVDLGSFKSLLHKHDLSRTLSVSLTFDAPRRRTRLPIAAVARPPRFQVRRVTTEFRAVSTTGARKKDSSSVAGVRYELEGFPPLSVGLRRRDGPAKVVGGELFQWADRESPESLLRYWINSDSRWKTALNAEVSGVANDPVRYAQTLDTVSSATIRAAHMLPDRLEFERPVNGQIAPTSRFPSTLTALAGEYLDLLGSLLYLGPLRMPPARHYLVIGPAKDTVGVRGENTAQLILRQRSRIETRVNKWFRPPAGDRPGFDIPYRLRVRSVGDEVTGEIVVLTLVDGRTGAEVALNDVGFGIGQLLPMVVQGLVAQNRILCVEQPEIHLHPRLQAHVADLLIETAGLDPSHRKKGDDGLKNQWIVETHSEALLLRLQRRVREKRIKASDVSVLYVQPSGECGSELLQLRMDDQGEFIDEWPDGFFEESYKELFSSEASE